MAATGRVGRKKRTCNRQLTKIPDHNAKMSVYIADNKKRVRFIVVGYIQQL